MLMLRETTLFIGGKTMQYPISFFSPFLVRNEDPLEQPRVEDGDDEINLSFELPGFEKGKISILREGTTLSISADKETRTKHGSERRSYSQRFSLPGTVDLENIDAEYKDGVLSIKAAKKEESKPRRIEIR
jgi:HSP20 family protein